jgi:hypothetical protein
VLVNIELRKAAGLGLALVAALGFTLIQMIPAAAQERATQQQRPPVQALPGAHQYHPGLPNRFNGVPEWPTRQAFPIMQMCAGAPYSPFYGPLSGSPIATQTSAFQWTDNGMQGSLSGPDSLSWYGAGGMQAAWWSYPYATTNPALSSCGGFQGFQGFQGWGP